MDMTAVMAAARRLMQCRPKCESVEEFVALAETVLQAERVADQHNLARSLGVPDATVKGLVLVCGWAIEFIEHTQADGRRVSKVAIKDAWPVAKEEVGASQWCAPTRPYRLGMGAAFLRDSVRLSEV